MVPKYKNTWWGWRCSVCPDWTIAHGELHRLMWRVIQHKRSGQHTLWKNIRKSE